MAGFASLPSILLGIEWLTARLSLGHAPVGGVDDPKSISWFCNLLHNLTLFSIPASFAGILGTGSLLLRNSQHTPSAAIRLAIPAMIAFFVTGMILLFFRMPDDLMGWWLD